MPILITLNVSLDFTLVASAWFIALSNCNSTLIANWGVICPYYNIILLTLLFIIHATYNLKILLIYIKIEIF